MEYIRPPRDDEPGTWHHVMNRGLARRTVFETEDEIRHFLALIARSVRKGQIEIHVYSFLTTHFHALIRSPRGELSDAMMWIESNYVRWFNRRKGRDGPLFRGRFRSRIVDTSTYWFAVVRYIDRNCVDAGLVARARDYPHGSARHYCNGHGPPWLERSVVERRAVEWSQSTAYDSAAYEQAFSRPPRPGLSWLVRRRVESGAAFLRRADSLDDLLRAAPSKVRARFLEHARLADGAVSPEPIVDPDTVSAAVDGLRAAPPNWNLGTRRGRRADLFEVLRVGLLHDVCGLSQREIAAIVRGTRTNVARHQERHRELLACNDEYAVSASETVMRCVRAVYE